MRDKIYVKKTHHIVSDIIYIYIQFIHTYIQMQIYMFLRNKEIKIRDKC